MVVGSEERPEQQALLELTSSFGVMVSRFSPLGLRSTLSLWRALKAEGHVGAVKVAVTTALRPSLMLHALSGHL